MFVSLSVAKMRTTVHKNAICSKTKQFRAIIVAIHDLWEVLHWIFEEPIIYWTLKIQDGGDPPS